MTSAAASYAAAYETIAVDLGQRGYDIRVGQGLLGSAGRHLQDLLKGRPAVVVTDETIARLHLPAFTAGLAREGIAARPLVLAPGEARKSFADLESLVDLLLEARVERSDAIVALGGGVIGDLTGFAAAILRRGSGFIQVPTTLLAQVDSSVGGKTGINTRHGKNLVGAFHQPRRVLADVGVLDTLPRRELLAGYAEVVKYGLLGDAAFFAWLEGHARQLLDGDPALRRQAVAACCRAKAAIVGRDEREGGERALLNLGHTFGHALEAELGYTGALLHGEAVAIGMVLAFELSARLGFCPIEDVARVRRHLALVGLPAGIEPGLLQCDARCLYEHMRQDKKAQAGRLAFILVKGIGKAFVTREVPEAEVLALLEEELLA